MEPPPPLQPSADHIAAAVTAFGRHTLAAAVIRRETTFGRHTLAAAVTAFGRHTLAAAVTAFGRHTLAVAVKDSLSMARASGVVETPVSPQVPFARTTHPPGVSNTAV
jgi:hypothetical protein